MLPSLTIDRRGLLRLGLSFGALRLARPARAAGAAAGDPPAPGRLVLLQLGGGNDGLSTVVPYADDDYRRLRPTLRLEPSEVLRLDERRGLHPALVRLRERFERGQLALVEGVGYEPRERSHFRSLAAWHSADPRGRPSASGWVGRLVEHAFAEPDPLRVVHVGDSVPFSLASPGHPPLGFVAPRALRRLGLEDEAQALAEPPSAGDATPALAHVREVSADARAAAARLLAALDAYEPRAEYSGDGFSQGLRTIAAILGGGLGTRVLSIELAGFDTHNDQRRRHDRQMEALDRGLGAFLDDLDASEAGRDTVVCAFSEFGRRVAENGSRGTDHGTAGPVLVAGARVAGGFHGRPASLAALEEGDPRPTTDFRSVYATLVRALFGVAPEAVLGARHAPLAFL